MPTLSWLGKKKIVNHHLDVPFYILDKKYNFESHVENKNNSSGNRIIHGDNLAVLKSLLPEFEGKIDCIYIDPPYNTGNEKWIYNDNVNDPRIKKWLNTVVGKDGEDLSRHDKWLCMIYPRIKLLHQLLSENGSIFISIDDNEQASLKLVCDEIFGANNFIDCLVWQKTFAPKNDAKYFSSEHEYVLVYAKEKNNFSMNLLERGEKQNSRYSNPDNDSRGPWASTDLLRMEHRDNSVYKIVSPTGKEWMPESGTSWRHPEDEMLALIANNEVVFGKDGNAKPRRKKFLKDVKQGVVSQTIWKFDEVSHTQEAKQTLNRILDKSGSFDNPKPIALIQKILKLVTSLDSIILDSFAGSATTAHAVLKLNAEDGGNRRFILCEMMNYAETITAERVRRAMDGYGEGKTKTEGLGGSFEYLELGEPLFLENELLNESVGIERIRQYVSYSERIPLEQQLPVENSISPSALGINEQTLWLFNYDKNAVTSLDLDFLGSLNLRELKQRPSQYVIYADKCVLENKFMQDHGITFKRIPRDILRF